MSNCRQLHRALRTRLARGLAFGLLAMAIAVLPAAADTPRLPPPGLDAGEQLSCFASGSLGLLPNDGFACNSVQALAPGKQIDVTYRFTNTSFGLPGNVPVAVSLRGVTTATLACETTNCAVQLPGTLSFVSVNGNGCVASDPAVVSCSAAGNNQVLITMTPGGVQVPAGGQVAVATIRVEAGPTPVGGASCGIFGSRADTEANDILTTDPDCDVQATGGAQGSGNLFYPECADDLDCSLDPGLDPECASAFCDIDAVPPGSPPRTGQCVTELVDDSTPCTDTGLDCWIAGCEAGQCVQNHVAEQVSTPCDEVAGSECADPGCDGQGNCVPDHLPLPDSTPCTDTTAQDCFLAGCEAGFCVQEHAFQPASTPCDPDGQQGDSECADPGCDGQGNCVPDHLPAPDSTPCTDSDLDCWIAGCEAGVCVQDHIPEPSSTPCDEVAGTECADPGCDGQGNCVADHLPVPDSTPCTDTDPANCHLAGCEAGVCVQTHTCAPDEDPALCNVMIGDFIWLDDGDGIQQAESGINDVDLNIWTCDANGQPVAVVGNETTAFAMGTDGFYKFTLLTCEPSERLLVEVDVSNFAAGGALEDLSETLAFQGGDETVDSNCVDRLSDCRTIDRGAFDDTVDCGYVQAVGICRTPGFWGARGGNERGNVNYTQAVIDAAGGSLAVCGQVITSTSDINLPDLGLGTLDSALEGLCVRVQGVHQRQLYRQLTAAALNCVLSGGDCNTLIPWIGGLDFDQCSLACEMGDLADPAVVQACIDQIDCWNNGGFFDGECSLGQCEDGGVPTGQLCSDDADCTSGGFCEPFDGNCHDRSICESPTLDLDALGLGETGSQAGAGRDRALGAPQLGPPLALDGDDCPLGGASSPRACNAARTNDCTIDDC